MNPRAPLPFLCLAAALACAAPAVAAQRVALRPDAVLGAGGQMRTGVTVVVDGERIVEVEEGEAPDGAVALAGVLAPGMVDACSSHGALRFITEQSSRATPELAAGDAVDAHDEDWQRLLAHGVTAVHLMPDPTNVLAGRGALLAGGDPPRMLDDATVQCVSLVASSIRDERVGPTSLAGGLELLEESLAARPQAVAGGAFVFVENAEGVRGARTLLEGAEAAPTFVLWGDPGTYGGEIAGQRVVLPAVGGGNLARRAETWRRLHEAGTRVAFGSRGGNAEHDALRSSAMLYSRATGDPAAAWAAVTTHAAALLGREGEWGVIAPGARADLVLWSGHPLDATARVQAVMIGGDTVHRAAPQENDA